MDRRDEWHLFFETLKPASGGWEQLQTRISQAELETTRDLLAWRVAASFLLVLLAGSYFSPRMDSSRNPEPSPNRIEVEGHNIAEIPNAPKGVRFYWVFR